MPQPTNIIYLASKSPRRRELLKQIGIQFELLMMREQSPRGDVDEAPLANEAAHVYVERIALLKARIAMKAMRERRLPTRLILTADTTVTIDGEVLGKPVDLTTQCACWSGSATNRIRCSAPSRWHPIEK